MPTGRVHAATTLGAALLTAPLVLSVSQPGHALAWTGGCLCGLVLTPDLDIERPTRSHAVVRRSLGKWWMLAWFVFWYPYARLLPHRSRWSHAPVLGTLLRLAYIGLPAALLWVLLHGGSPPLGWLKSASLGWAVGGLMLSDALHALLDRVF